jgi:histidine triad (HIT) family protein
MPRLIPKDEAVARVERERQSWAGRAGERCLMCELIERVSPEDRLAESADCLVMMSRYPRAWGHLLVVPRVHTTSFRHLDDRTWAEISSLAARAARALESTLEPARCYVASLGTAATDIPMSSPHLHVHVIPVQDPEVSPSRMLSWDAGVWEGSAQEWSDLRVRLSEGWSQA